MRRICAAKSTVYVCEPRWSVTTRSSGLCAALARIVSTKFRPSGPNTHCVRTIQNRGCPGSPGLEQLLAPLVGGMTATRDSLLTWIHACGVAALNAMFREQAEAVAGPKGQHQAGRTHHHWGTTPTELTLGGRRGAARGSTLSKSQAMFSTQTRVPRFSKSIDSIPSSASPPRTQAPPGTRPRWGGYLGIPRKPVLAPPGADRKEVADSPLVHQLATDRQLVQFATPSGHFAGI